jgi:hypothetical protein
MCMAIFKSCLANQFYNLNFIKHKVKSVLSSSTLPMTLTMTSLANLMNSKKRTTNKLFVASYCCNLVNGFSRFCHGLRGLILHGPFEKKTLKIQNVLWQWLKKPFVINTNLFGCIVKLFNQCQMVCKKEFTI